MKFYFKQPVTEEAEEDLNNPKINLLESIEKTRQALENAYTGFNNALDRELIDCYIYEINSLQQRYTHLVHLFCAEDLVSGSSLEFPTFSDTHPSVLVG